MAASLLGLLGAGAAPSGGGGGVTTYRDAVLADSPVAYWRFAEVAGTTAADASGNGHDGTYVNTPTLGAASPISDTGDTAVSFASASSEYVTVPHHAALAITGDLTLEAWVKPTDRADYYFIVTKDSGSSPRPYEWRLTTGTGEPVFVSGGGTQVVAGDVVPTGAWSHLAVTYDLASGALQHYINGVAKGAGNFGTTTDAGTALKIGTRDDLFSYFNGAIDEVAVYNTKLSGARIAAHYAAR